MKQSKEMLSSVLKTAQMGQVGIRSVLSTPMSGKLHQAMCDQLREYDAIADQAQALALQRGWQVNELAPIAKTMSSMMAKAKLGRKSSDSRLAGMLIQGNTIGMIKSISNLHSYQKQDRSVSELSQRLLDAENANIRQMQDFL